jgi:hypothetical protein
MVRREGILKSLKNGTEKNLQRIKELEWQRRKICRDIINIVKDGSWV